MTTVLLIRHATHQLPDNYIAGRMPGVHLSREGLLEAEKLAGWLARAPIKAIYSSPLERARETAAPIADYLGLQVQVSQDINEIDFGDWTNRTIEELSKLKQWQLFNSLRSGTRIPNGELMLEAQTRTVRAIERVCERHPDEQVALVTHGDIIKSALAYFLGVHLDLFQRIEISRCSLSIVANNEYGPRILGINQRPNLPL